MAVLFISYKYPPEIGGMQKQSYELITGCRRQADVHTIIIEPDQSVLFFFVSLFWRIPLMLRAHRNIQLIHCNDGVCGLLCAWVKVITSTALVVTYHGLDLVYPSWLYQNVLLRLMHSFDAVITVSQYTKSACINRGFDPSKVFVVTNGVDTDLSVDLTQVDPAVMTLVDSLSSEDKRLIISIGRPVRRKGFVWFVKAVVSRLDQNHVFILIGPKTQPNRLTEWLLSCLPRFIQDRINLFFGRSTEQEELSALAQTYSSQFIWLSDVNHQSKLYLLAQANLFVMPNVKVAGDMEGFGLVALEANVLGTYVMAADLEGITSAVSDTVNGRLVKSADQDLWLDNIEEFFQNKIHYDLLFNSLQQSKFDQQNSWNRMVDEYLTVFNKIARSREQSSALIKSSKTVLSYPLTDSKIDTHA